MATAADVNQPWLSGQNQIDALLWQTFHWQYQTPSDPAIYYTFSTSEGNQTDGFIVTTNLTPFNSAQQDAARQAVANVSAVTGIQFVEVANGNDADIHFANGHIGIPASAATTGSIGYSYFPDKILTSYRADAWIYLDSDEHRDFFLDPAPGTGGYQVVLHELGHALALKHPHEGTVRLSPSEDNTENTVMSYNWVGAPKDEFQEFDVAALQWWYGTDGLGGVSYGGTTTAVINGTAAADRLNGGAGSDTVSGGAGNDTLIGGGGNDVMEGGAGIDSMDGGLGSDTYFVTAGDVITDAGGLETVVADVSWTLGAGFEDLWLGPGNLPLAGHGNSLPNLIWGNDGDNLLKGAGGNDEIHDYGQGNDTLAGGTGNDLLIAYYGDDAFLFEEAPGAANADRIFWFGVGADKIQLDSGAHPNLGPIGAFAPGDGRFFAGPGASSGQDASDRVIYNTSTGELWYDPDGSGADAAQLIARMEPIPTLAASDIIVVGATTPGVRLTGTAGNDSLVGGAGDDTLDGLAGNDTLVGNAGSDSLIGGTGNDLIAEGGGGDDVIDGGTGLDSIEFRERATSAVVVDFGAGTITGGGPGTISFINVERVVAGNFNDSLTGNTAAQTLTGQGGADTLWGAGGVDTLWGGGGADTFIFRETGTVNADRINDWTSGSDKLVLDASVMSALGASGNFATGDARFAANATGTAQDSSDRIIFNTTTRQVFYDADGSGSGAAQLIATLQSGATLVATDIAVEGGSGGGGPGTIVGTEGNDSLTGTDGNDTIDARGGNDTLDGAAGEDLLLGGSGNDVLIDRDGESSDTLDGGLGDDTYHVGQPFDPEPHTVIVDAGGIDTVISPEDYRLGSGLENLTIGGNGSSGIGNELDNIITSTGNEPHQFFIDGADGDDTLIGGSDREVYAFTEGSGDYGHDSVDGGDDFDTLSFFNASSAIVVDMRAGTLSGGGVSGSGSVTFANIEAVDGGAFDDHMTAPDAFGASLHGFGGNDTLLGGAADDFLEGGNGNDVIRGGGGDDAISLGFSGASYGNDSIDGGSGIDIVILGNAASGVVADLQAGTLSGGGAGGAGSAMLAGIENFSSGGGNDRLTGSSAANELASGTGNDTLVGGDGDDSLQGDLGNDELYGGNGNDFVSDFGDGGLISGGAGNDTLQGGDRLLFAEAPGSANADFASFFQPAFTQILLDNTAHASLGPAGNFAAGDARFAANSSGTAQDTSDRVVYNTATGQLWYDADGSGAGAAQLIVTLGNVPTLAATNIEVVGAGGGGSGGQAINGTAGNDTLSGGPGNDTINGLGGNDLFLAGASGGADVIDGGAGLDSIEFRDRATSAVVVDFGAGTITGGGPGTISFASVERVVAGNFNDALTGNAAAQTLTGQAGADTLWGAGGVDTLWGGGGADRFIFRETGAANADLVRDWASGSDKLALDDAAMSALGAAGNFSSGDARFAAGAGFSSGRDASDRVVFDTSTGRLYYDADGSGAGASQLIATVQSGASVVATDIVVI